MSHAQGDSHTSELGELHLPFLFDKPVLSSCHFPSSNVMFCKVQEENQFLSVLCHILVSVHDLVWGKLQGVRVCVRGSERIRENVGVHESAYV